MSSANASTYLRIGDEVTHAFVRGITGVIEGVTMNFSRRASILMYKTKWTRDHDGTSYYTTEPGESIVGPKIFRYDPKQAGEHRR